MASLVIELVLFILARNKARNYQGGNGQTPTGSNLGPAIWMQVASLPPVFFGFMMLALGWYLKRSASQDNYYNDDYNEPARAVYASEAYPAEKNDNYYYNQPPPPAARPISRASRRSRYDDYYEPEERVYGNVGRRDSRRTNRSAYTSGGDDYDRYDNRRSFDDRAPRRSYGGDPYGSRANLAPPVAGLLTVAVGRVVTASAVPTNRSDDSNRNGTQRSCNTSQKNCIRVMVFLRSSVRTERHDLVLGPNLSLQHHRVSAVSIHTRFYIYINPGSSTLSFVNPLSSPIFPPARLRAQQA